MSDKPQTFAERLAEARVLVTSIYHPAFQREDADSICHGFDAAAAIAREVVAEKDKRIQDLEAQVPMEIDQKTRQARARIIEVLVDGWGVRSVDAAEQADAICEAIFPPAPRYPSRVSVSQTEESLGKIFDAAAQVAREIVAERDAEIAKRDEWITKLKKDAEDDRAYYKGEIAHLEAERQRLINYTHVLGKRAENIEAQSVDSDAFAPCDRCGSRKSLHPWFSFGERELHEFVPKQELNSQESN